MALGKVKAKLHSAIGAVKAAQPAPVIPPKLDPLQQLKKDLSNGQPLSMERIVGAMPDYKGITNTNGTLKDPFVMQAMTIDPKLSEQYRAMEGMAKSPDPTELFFGQKRLIDNQATSSLDRLARDTGRQTQGAYSDLAMGGGLDSGARERIARGGMHSNLAGGADILTGATQAIGGAAAADAAYKASLRDRLLGVDLNGQQFNAGVTNQARAVNVGHAIGDVGTKNAYELDRWMGIGDIYGSDQASKAMMGAANAEDPGLLGSGGILGTGIGGQKGLFGTGLFGGKGGSRDAAFTAGGAMIGGPVGAAAGYGISRTGNATGWF